MIEKIGPMECDICGRKWIAAMECAETERLECPDCGCMIQVPPSDVSGKTLACAEQKCDVCDGRIVQCGDELRCERCNKLIELL